MDWKKLLGSLSESVDEELRLRNAYLAAENRILRQQIPGRVQLSDGDRHALAEIGQQLGRKALEEIATVAKPDTILAWHRQCASPPGDISPLPKSVGRPRIAQEIKDLVVQIARENRSWGYDRIVGVLANLGYTISDQTVGNILKRHGIPPAPERKKTMTWREFIRIHMDVLEATDFFTSTVWGWFRLAIASFLCFMAFRHWKRPGVSLTARLNAWFAAWHTDVERWIQTVLAPGLSWLLPYGQRVGPSLLSGCETAAHCAHVPQGLGNVVRLPAVPLHPIQDGPMRGQPQLDSLLEYDNREAA
jgi:hypothetical protein